jgi:hypothetical protein
MAIHGSPTSLARGEVSELALAYAKNGIPVFPIAISWDEAKHETAKRPLTQHGHHNAKTDPEAVRALFARCRLREGEVLGVGLWPGPAGYVVLDVDTKNGKRGDEELARLEERHGPLPDTVRVTSASGGFHLWLTKPDGTTGRKIALDIDTRADSGWVVAPGTRTPWGSWEFDGEYDLLAGFPVAEPPPWLVVLLTKADETTATATTSDTGVGAITAVPAPDVELPAIVTAMISNDRAFSRVWGHKTVVPVGDDSQSSIDFSIAKRLAAAGATNDDIAAAITVNRREYGTPADIKKSRRRDYLERTIRKARTPRKPSPHDRAVDTMMSTFTATIERDDEPTRPPVVQVAAAPARVDAPGAGAPAIGDPATRLPQEAWEARWYLRQIRQAAQARQISPEAVLVSVLARVAAFAPPTITIPAIVGAESTLSEYAALAAPTGGAKTTPTTTARNLLPMPWSCRGKVNDGQPIGSGEGFTDCLFEMRKEDTGRGSKPVKVKVYDGAFFTIDEGTVLSAFTGRNGNVTVPAMCTAWTGAAPAGQRNATADRTRVVPPYSAVYGVVLGIQPANAGALFAHTVSGLPGRFVYASSIDPTLPDHPPEWPGPLEWAPPSAEELSKIEVLIRERTEANEPDEIHYTLGIDPTIAVEVQTAHLARMRGEIVVDDLDGHAHLLQLKIAAGLMLLDGRRDDRLTITTEDWALADLVMNMSNAVRANVIATLSEVRARTEAAASKKQADRGVATAAAIELDRTIDAARKIANRVYAEPTRWTRGSMYSELRRHRDVFDDALDHAIAARWVIELSEPGQGTHKRALRPGDRKP